MLPFATEDHDKQLQIVQWLLQNELITLLQTYVFLLVPLSGGPQKSDSEPEDIDGM